VAGGPDFGPINTQKKSKFNGMAAFNRVIVHTAWDHSKDHTGKQYNQRSHR